MRNAGASTRFPLISCNDNGSLHTLLKWLLILSTYHIEAIVSKRTLLLDENPIAVPQSTAEPVAIPLAQASTTSHFPTMLAIQPSSKSQKCTLNLLPARLNHNGPINDAEQYWKPTKNDEGTFLLSSPYHPRLYLPTLRKIPRLLPRPPPSRDYPHTTIKLHRCRTQHHRERPPSATITNERR